MVNPIIYISQPSSLSLLVIPRAKLCTRAQCPRRPALNWLNSLSQDPCTSLSSHGEDTRNKQLLHIPDGRARQMSKANQRERRGKVYEPAFANLSVLSSKTGYSWENSRPALSCEGLPQSGPTQQQRASNNIFVIGIIISVCCSSTTALEYRTLPLTATTVNIKSMVPKKMLVQV